jgi:hypothetical protein
MRTPEKKQVEVKQHNMLDNKKTGIMKQKRET